MCAIFLPSSAQLVFAGIASMSPPGGGSDPEGGSDQRVTSGLAKRVTGQGATFGFGGFGLTKRVTSDQRVTFGGIRRKVITREQGVAPSLI